MNAETQTYEFGGLPEGCWFDLINIAIIKYCLQSKMDDEMRLEFSQRLENSALPPITDEMVRIIAPACGATWEMYKETLGLGIDDRCRVMRSKDVFREFIRLNPTIMDAIKLFASRQNPRLKVGA